jgi:hypothetical protein
VPCGGRALFAHGGQSLAVVMVGLDPAMTNDGTTSA